MSSLALSQDTNLLQCSLIEFSTVFIDVVSLMNLPDFLNVGRPLPLHSFQMVEKRQMFTLSFSAAYLTKTLR